MTAEDPGVVLQRARELLIQGSARDAIAIATQELNQPETCNEQLLILIQASRQLNDHSIGPWIDQATEQHAERLKVPTLIQLHEFARTVQDQPRRHTAACLLSRHRQCPRAWLTAEARSLIALKQPDLANQHLKQLKQTHPDLEWIPLARAELFESKGEKLKLKRLLRRAARKFPTHPEIQDRWLDYLVSHGRTERARALSKRFVNRSDKANSISVQALRKPLQVFQYFNPHPHIAKNKHEMERINALNYKATLQWQAALGPDGHYELVNWQQAFDLIATWHGQAAAAAFEQCRLPAMQADVFRLAHLAHHRHALYIDWPYRPWIRQPLLSCDLLKDQISILSGKIRANGWRVVNTFAYNNNDAQMQIFFNEIFTQVLNNIRSRRANNQPSNNVLHVTGPRAWSTVLNDDTVATPRHKRITLPFDLEGIFSTTFDKRKDMRWHWSNIQKAESIYTYP